MKAHVRTFLCGLAMGAADIVPGVSGGTIAFISGIYEQLLNAVKSFDLAFFRLLLSLRIREALQRIPWDFLLPLVCGIALSIFSLARLTLYLLHSWPEALWAFFLGLIIASILILLKGQKLRLPELFFMVIGAVCAWMLSGAEAMSVSHTPLHIFLAGFIALCAMILPGISGSFMLVLLGQYAFILSAVAHLNILILMVFLGGGICGLMTFSRILSACFRRWSSETSAALIGVMAGCLRTVWPWHQQNLPALPPAFDAMTALAAAAFLAGCALPLAVQALARQKKRLDGEHSQNNT
ncbi:DUF368 domain-containing protein [uncultured Mailhella sp.]|uniref:DUF368 domain-containing protein n=1 Tax=uncultured Mailhella sp. TaxID=1981031 RepID=UPI00262D3C7E|nr:DUF368 domain-containing protein [uncultured Mailhella sp.]